MLTLLDLLLPTECGGCRAPGAAWCAACTSAVAAAEPLRLDPRVAGVPPAWATGPYAGPWRGAVLAAKERGRRDLHAVLGGVLAAAVGHLREWGELDPAALSPLVLVAAPTRRAAARRRGGDPVLALARECARQVDPGERVAVLAPLRTGWRARDSVGLSPAQRTENLRARVHVRGVLPPAGATVVLVDDVLTTGATAAESVRVLQARGVRVDAVLVVAAA